MAQETFLYQLDERPPLHKNLIYGLQWVMTSIPSVVFFSTLCGVALGLDPAAQISFSQRLLIISGLMTVLQSLSGHRYPVLEGPSSAILVTFMVLAPHGGLPVIEGGMIFGGLFLILIGIFKWLKWLSSLFTPRVVGVILVLVALTLISFIYPLLIGISKTAPFGEVSIFGSSLLIILLVSFMSHRLKGFLQTTSMLAGILFGLVLFFLKGGISFSLVSQSSWFALPSPLLGVWPRFSLPAILAIVCTYLAVMVNSLGSIQGISEVVGTEGLENRIHRGIGMTGVGGVIAGFLGVSGLVSLSISPGIVLVTRVASRYTLTMSGVIMILCAFIPKLWAVLTAVPPSVIGSVLFVVLSSQLLVGINVMLARKGTIERREYFTVGIPILMGAMISIMPKQFFQLFPNIIASLVGNGLVMGILFSLLLEHVLFRQRKENR
ncbi:MAG TPA: solute carrier family 23 protein [Thermodesulfobacteriota bacterium]|nr:solute carrier family 23 protein [Thermodesulfobacteriota bacterium]